MGQQRAEHRPSTVVTISPGDPAYPPALADVWQQPLPTLTARGNLGLIERSPLALFCSRQCPGRLILQLYDLAQTWSAADVPIIGGFHTPLEQEVLRLLLRGTVPIVVCAARNIEGMRVPGAWGPALAAGRLLMLSPFDARHPRVTAATAAPRNRLVAALAAQIFVAHAAPGSQTEALCREARGWGRPLLTLAGPENAHLAALGANPLEPAAEHA